MQDPVRKHHDPDPPESKGQQPDQAPVNTPPPKRPAITRDEEEAGKYPDHRDIIDEILTTTKKRIEKGKGGIKETKKTDGSTKTEFIFPDRTVSITISRTREGIVRELEIALARDDENTRELLNELGPYQTSFHGRGLDNKQRTFWPAKWKKAIPTIAIYDPKGPDPKIIFTSDPEINVPRGWVVTRALNFTDTGGAGQLRISLSTIFGKNKRIQWPDQIDFNGHGTYVTVVTAGSPDFADKI
jgi:hypothetical protein